MPRAVVVRRLTHIALCCFRAIGSAYEKGRDLVQIGAYASGSDPALDEAIQLHVPMDAFLQQDMFAPATLPGSLSAMQSVVSGPARQP